MNKISDITRQDILDIIKDGFVRELNEPVYDGESGKYITEYSISMPYCGRLEEIAFFSRIYNLEEMPSYDHRYQNALGDITCHMRWGDYDDDFWFFTDERFQLRDGDGDEPLLRFVCEMLHPAVRNEKSPWKQYLEKFNEILMADGYELYPAQHISGRSIYKYRECSIQEIALLPDNLFSERYKELIEFGNGESVDNISGSIDFKAKKHLVNIMFEFAEPIRYQPNRYDNWVENTNALLMAISNLNEFLECPVINIDNMFSPTSSEDILASHFTPFVLDVIEYQYSELSTKEKAPFQERINASLQKDNIDFRLTDRGLIEFVPSHEVLSSEIINIGNQIKEPGLKELFDSAVEKHMQPNMQSHKDAVEKIWDVLERLKTYYTELDKKHSAEKIVLAMANGQNEFATLFETEFKALTDIGNNYRIRHHETNKIDITDVRHYDYFFNRCLSLIALALQYLE